MSNKNKLDFIKWVKINQPELYNAALVETVEGGVGIPWAPTKSGNYGEKPAPSWVDKMTGVIGSLAPQLIKLRQQRSLMRMQIKRARQGLPPANVADYTPVIKTRIDVGADTRNALIAEGRRGFKAMALPAAGIIGVGLLIFALKKK